MAKYATLQHEHDGQADSTCDQLIIQACIIMLAEQLHKYVDRVHNYLLLLIPVMLLMNSHFHFSLTRFGVYTYIFLLYALGITRVYNFLWGKVSQPQRIALISLFVMLILVVIYVIYHTSGLI